MPPRDDHAQTNRSQQPPRPQPSATDASSYSPASSFPNPPGGHAPIRRLRTYKDDLAEAIKRGGYSKASISEAERVKKETPTAPPRPFSIEKPKPPVPPPAPSAPIPTPPQAPNRPTTPPAPPRPVAPPVPPSRPVAPPPPPRPIPPPAPEPKKIPTPPAPQKEPAATPTMRAEPPPPPPRPVAPPPQPPQPRAPAKPSEPEQPSAPQSPSPFLPVWAMPSEATSQTAQSVPTPSVDFPPAFPLQVPRELPRISVAQKPSALRSVIFTIMFFALAGGLGYGGYVFYQLNTRPSQNISLSVPSQDLIPLSESVTLDATTKGANDIATMFLDKVRAGTKQGNTLGIVLAMVSKTEARPFTSDEFFSRTETNAPGIFTRSLEPTFTAGVYGKGAGFLVFKTYDYGRALSGLLAWERSMPDDLRPLFGTDLHYDALFLDKTIGGVDARVAGSGESALVYGIVNHNYIVIAHGEGTFATIASLVGTQQSSSR